MIPEGVTYGYRGTGRDYFTSWDRLTLRINIGLHISLCMGLWVWEAELCDVVKIERLLTSKKIEGEVGEE